jgi:transposase
LIEAPKERSSTGIGFLTITPKRLDRSFRFTIISNALDTAECLFWLHEIHRHDRRKVLMVWDNLSAHHAAAAIMNDTHPNWFDFYFFPPYSPELNPVEPCWHHTKNIEMANCTPKNKNEMIRNILQATKNINNDKRLIASFFKHAGINI